MAYNNRNNNNGNRQQAPPPSTQSPMNAHAAPQQHAPPPAHSASPQPPTHTPQAVLTPNVPQPQLQQQGYPPQAYGYMPAAAMPPQYYYPQYYMHPSGTPYSPNHRQLELHSPVGQHAAMSPHHLGQQVASRSNPSGAPKVHTPIKLSDPLTHQPIDLTSARSSGKQSQASTPSSVQVHLASSSSPRPGSSPLPVNSNTQLANSPGKTSPSKPARTQEQSINIKDQFRAQIQLAKEKADRDAKEAKAKDDKVKADKEAVEKAERDAKEQAEKEALEKVERAKKEAEEKERLAKEAESAAAAAATIAAEESAAAAAAATTAAAEDETAAPEKLVSDAPNAEQEDKVAEALATVNEKVAEHENTIAQTQLLVKALETTAPTTKEVNEYTYPVGIKASEVKCTETMYKYDQEFLMQFQAAVRFPPSENWEDVIKVISTGKGDKGYGKGGYGSRSNSVRNGPPSAMGSFGAGGPGFRSDRSVSSSMAGGPGGFGGMGNHKLNRMHSSSNLSSSMSKRQGSRRRGGGRDADRSNSRNDKKGRNDDDEEKIPAAPVVPAPPRSANAWVPRVRKSKDEEAKENTPSEENRLEPEIVQRKVKSLLNKMTLENFDRISSQIMEIAGQSKFEKDGRTLRQVIELTFAKAIDEAHWSSMYAKFCAKLWSEVDENIEDEEIKDANGNAVKGGQLFRKYLLNRCQAEFEKGWSDKLPTNPDGTPITDAELMSDEYYAAVAAKRRGLGLIRFIGELYILQLLSEKIIHTCIAKLCSTEDPSEETIESLCQLMTTTGSRLDASPRGKKFMNVYFTQMREVQIKPSLPSRLRFMLMDVADLRNSNWVNKNADKGPKTIADIQEEANKKQAEEQARKDSRRGGGGGGGYGGGRHDRDRVANSVNVPGDLSRIGRIRSNDGRQTLGPASLMNREMSGSGRRSGHGSSGFSSPATPLSNQASRSASQQSTTTAAPTRVNIFEHLNSDKEDEQDEADNDNATESAPAEDKE